MKLVRKFTAIILVLAVSIALLFLFLSQSGSNNTSSVDDWPVSRHDPAQTGFSSSKAPVSQIVQLWNYPIDTDSLAVLATPVVDDGCVYAVSPDHGMFCLRAADGTKVWVFKTETEMHSSPAAIDGLLYVGSDGGHVYCINASDGNQVWKKSVGFPANSPVNFVDGRVYVESEKGGLYCLDAADGEELWKFSAGADSYSRSPAISEDGYVFVTNYDGSVFCIDGISGLRIWNVTVGSELGSVVAVEGFVYFGSRNGNAYCLNASNGAKIWNYTAWYNSEGPAHNYDWGNGVSGLAVAYDHVYFGSSNFDIFCLDALTGKEMWSFSTGGIVSLPPSVAGGCVFAGSYDGELYCLNASSGAEIWRRAAGVRSPVNAAGAAGSPVIVKGVVYVVGNGVVSAWSSTSSDDSAFSNDTALSSDSTFPWVEVIIAVVLLITAAAIGVYINSKRK